jgi:hypothetical protein
MKKLVFATIALLILTSTSAYGQQRETLRGLGGVTVVVSVVGDAASKIPKGELQTYMEMRLREADIRVTQGEEVPRLILDVITLKDEEDGLYTLSVSLRLWQQVRLDRKPNFKFLAPTWTTTQMIMRGEKNVSDIRDSVQGAMDHFINEFLKVNPRMAAPGQR